MGKNLSFNKKRYALVAALFWATFLFLLVAQTCSGQITNSTFAQGNIKAKDLGVLHVVPLIWLLLPLAAVGAYFLERASSKMSSSKST